MGKVVEIDEKTRLRNEYVRTRIACRDVCVVPNVVESSPVLFIYDFFFEREIQDEDYKENPKSDVRVGES